MDARVSKMWYVHAVEYYLALKMKETWHMLHHGCTVKYSATKGQILYDCTCVSTNSSQIHRDRKLNIGCQGPQRRK
jgi:hypothetical protein